MVASIFLYHFFFSPAVVSVLTIRTRDSHLYSNTHIEPILSVYLPRCASRSKGFAVSCPLVSWGMWTSTVSLSSRVSVQHYPSLWSWMEHPLRVKIHTLILTSAIDGYEIIIVYICSEHLRVRMLCAHVLLAAPGWKLKVDQLDEVMYWRRTMTTFTGFFGTCKYE